jgi:hypothetical protein
MKSASRAPGPSAWSVHVRKPNDWMRSFRMFSPAGEGRAGAFGFVSSRTVMRTATFGSPLARMSSMRSSRDMRSSDLRTASTSTTACIVIDMRPFLPMAGASSRTTAPTYLGLCDSTCDSSAP